MIDFSLKKSESEKNMINFSLKKWKGKQYDWFSTEKGK